MVETDIGRVRDLIWRLFVGGFGTIDDIGDEFATCSVVTNQYTFFVLRNEFSAQTCFTYVGRDDEILDIRNLIGDVSPEMLVRLLGFCVLATTIVAAVGVELITWLVGNDTQLVAMFFTTTWYVPAVNPLLVGDGW